MKVKKKINEIKGFPDTGTTDPDSVAFRKPPDTKGDSVSKDIKKVKKISTASQAMPAQKSKKGVAAGPGLVDG